MWFLLFYWMRENTRDLDLVSVGWAKQVPIEGKSFAVMLPLMLSVLCFSRSASPQFNGSRVLEHVRSILRTSFRHHFC